MERTPAEPAEPTVADRLPRRPGTRGAGWLRRAPLLPALLFTVVVTQLPFLLTLWYSFQDYQLLYPTRPRNFPTLDNYRLVFSDDVFRSAVITTVILTLVPVLLSVVLGVIIAVLLNRRVFGRAFLRTLVISPFLVMSSAAALIWKFSILDTTFGVLNWFVGLFGMQPEDWISIHPKGVLIAFLTWQWTPFMVLLVLAGLQSQGDEILEAARVDGARAWQIFRSLTLPHLRPYIELGVLLGSIYIVQAFDGVYMITQGGPSTDSTNLPYYIYRVGFTGSLNIGRASAMSVVVVVATILIATLALRMVSSLFSDEGMRSR
jgi:sorbitol/mannitol transport system permease protein